MSKLFSKSKSVLSIVLVLCLLALMLPAGLGALVAKAEAWDGTYQLPGGWGDDSFGTAGNPYQISTVNQLALLAAVCSKDTTSAASGSKTVTLPIGLESEGITETFTASSYGWFYGKHFKLMNDIDLSGFGDWDPIGNRKGDKSNPFCGSFNGGGHTISGMTVPAPATTLKNPTGFFGYVSGPNVTIENLYVSGTVNNNTTGVYTPGGLIGRFESTGNTTVKNCSFNGTVKNTAGAAGGLIGSYTNYGNTTLTIENCYFNGTVSAATWDPGNAGALVGTLGSSNSTTATVRNSYTTGENIGWRVGGLVGSVTGANTTLNIEDCYSDMTVAKSFKNAAGGLVGYVNANTGAVTIESSHFAGTVGNACPIVAAGTNVTASNVYYLEGSYTGEAVEIAGATQKTGTEFANGTVAGLLNGDRTGAAAVWTNWDGYAYPILSAPISFTNVTFTDKAATVTPENGTFTFGVASQSENTVVTVVGAADNEDGTYTVTTEASETKTVTITASTKNGYSAQYTLTVVDNRWDGSSKAPLTQNGSVYEIWSAAQLAQLAADVNGGTTYRNLTIKLCADINLNNKAWTPIGSTSTNIFRGTFDGGNHTISGLKVNVTSNIPAGFFGFISGTNDTITVKDLHVVGTVDSTSTSNNYPVGGLIGHLYNQSTATYTGKITIQNCTFEGDVTCTGAAATGGLIGRYYTWTEKSGDVDLLINNCSFNGDVEGVNVAGLLGQIVHTGATEGARPVTIRNSYTAGSATGTSIASGLLGYYSINAALNASTTLENCYSAMVVTAPADNSGGFFGRILAADPYPLNIKNCHFAGKTTKLPIVGKNDLVTLTDVYYSKDSYTSATATGTLTGATEMSAAEFADGTVAGLLGSGWATSVKGYPVLSDATITAADIFAAYAEGNYATNIRTTGNQGIRFKFAVNSEAVLNLNGLKEIGVVMAKQGDSSGNLREALAEGHLYLGATAYTTKSGAVYESGNTEFTFNYTDGKPNVPQIWATLTNFAPNKAAYEKVYIARAYAKYTDADGQELIVYSDAIDSREYYTSVYESAKYWSENGYEDDAFVQDVLSICNAQ